MGIKLFGKQAGIKECLKVNHSKLVDTSKHSTFLFLFIHCKNHCDNYKAHLVNNGKTCGYLKIKHLQFNFSSDCI